MIMLSRIYQECARLKQELSYLNTFLSWADRLALLCALAMMASFFLPWLSAEGMVTQTGIICGGNAHFMLAFITLMQVKNAALSHTKAIQAEKLSLLHFCLLRVSLGYLLIGMASVVISIMLLVYFGSIATMQRGLDVRYGFYITMTSGLIIFLCGLERFRVS